MGYSTSFELTWEATPAWKAAPLCSHEKSDRVKFCAECGKPNATVSLEEVVGDYIEEHEDMSYALGRDGSTNDSCKWYDHQEDLAAMSAEIPHVLFHLKGEGESAGDIWDAFALDGQVQKHAAKVVRVTAAEPWKKSALKGSDPHE